MKKNMIATAVMMVAAAMPVITAAFISGGIAYAEENITAQAKNTVVSEVKASADTSVRLVKEGKVEMRKVLELFGNSKNDMERKAKVALSSLQQTGMQNILESYAFVASEYHYPATRQRQMWHSLKLTFKSPVPVQKYSLGYLTDGEMENGAFNTTGLAWQAAEQAAVSFIKAGKPVIGIDVFAPDKVGGYMAQLYILVK